MQQSLASKQDWIQCIQQVLVTDSPFQYKATIDKLFILFAADQFRRNGNEVNIDIMPTETGISCLMITIFPKKTSLECTLRRDDEPSAIVQQIIDSNCTTVVLRGCGTVIQKLFLIIDWALHSGWYVENTMMSTLTQQTPTTKNYNTTLNISIKKGAVNSI